MHALLIRSVQMYALLRKCTNLYRFIFQHVTLVTFTPSRFIHSETDSYTQLELDLSFVKKKILFIFYCENYTREPVIIIGEVRST